MTSLVRVDGLEVCWCFSFSLMQNQGLNSQSTRVQTGWPPMRMWMFPFHSLHKVLQVVLQCPICQHERSCQLRRQFPHACVLCASQDLFKGRVRPLQEQERVARCHTLPDERKGLITVPHPEEFHIFAYIEDTYFLDLEVLCKLLPL